ncbi:response regulator [Brevibacillus fulvus]|nr:response regulator [Brevibacillus fulvus]
MAEEQIRVVLIEDDPMVQEVNRLFVERVPGFQVVGIAGSGTEGLQLVEQLAPDLVLLDIYMPAQDGIHTLHKLRSRNLATDVIAVTAANDAATIQQMLRSGVIDYIIKPFRFERVHQALLAYRERRERLAAQRDVTQAELDRLIHGEAGTVHPPETQPELASSQEELIKGINAATMKQVLQFLETHANSLSAEEVAEGLGIARVTARRYLDYLEKTGKVSLEIRYGGIGRPLNRYHLKRK